MRHHHFMRQFTTFKKNTFAIYGWDNLFRISVIDAEFAAVFGLPIDIEVHDHWKRTAFVVLKLVDVAFIETAFFVQRIVKFVARDARVTFPIEEQNEAVHEVEKTVFMHVIVAAVEPINLVAADEFVLQKHIVVADTRIFELIISVQCFQIGF